MDGHFLLKGVAVIAAVASFYPDLKLRRNKESACPAIAVADAKERQEWRYFRRGIRALRVLTGLWLLGPALSLF